MVQIIRFFLIGNLFVLELHSCNVYGHWERLRWRCDGLGDLLIYGSSSYWCGDDVDLEYTIIPEFSPRVRPRGEADYKSSGVALSSEALDKAAVDLSEWWRGSTLKLTWWSVWQRFTEQGALCSSEWWDWGAPSGENLHKRSLVDLNSEVVHGGGSFLPSSSLLIEWWGWGEASEEARVSWVA